MLAQPAGCYLAGVGQPCTGAGPALPHSAGPPAGLRRPPGSQGQTHLSGCSGGLQPPGGLCTNNRGQERTGVTNRLLSAAVSTISPLFHSSRLCGVAFLGRKLGAERVTIASSIRPGWSWPRAIGVQASAAVVPSSTGTCH